MYEPGLIPTNRGPHAAQANLATLPPQVNFRVSIPKAQAVAVVAGQNWTHLDRVQVGYLPCRLSVNGVHWSTIEAQSLEMLRESCYHTS